MTHIGLSLLALLADDSTPSPSPTFNPDTVTPGTIGFVITLFVAVGAVLLIIDMVRRIRRVNLKQQVKEKLDAEEAAAAAALKRKGNRNGKSGGSLPGPKKN
ncbi:hypothetical protein KPL76_13815 [Subtercola sp. PAMC28395]|uniref:hypothetical protein n=1 Tax=Subtercola sp. PAMC28395 TaxID=2846775 RepID=UPI001C0B90B3|nr:hypothetical protein [Subtercola sp. PAMC28395]QWT23743.1 hypothetical protein KPL76_13815 [Subtercola sp. PAMC28395]